MDTKATVVIVSDLELKGELAVIEECERRIAPDGGETVLPLGVTRVR